MSSDDELDEVCSGTSHGSIHDSRMNIGKPDKIYAPIWNTFWGQASGSVCPGRALCLWCVVLVPACSTHLGSVQRKRSFRWRVKQAGCTLHRSIQTQSSAVVSSSWGGRRAPRLPHTRGSTGHTPGVDPQGTHQGWIHRAHTRGGSTGHTPGVDPQGIYQGWIHRTYTRGGSTGCTPGVDPQGAHLGWIHRAHTWGGSTGHIPGVDPGAQPRGGSTGHIPGVDPQGPHQGWIHRAYTRGGSTGHTPGVDPQGPQSPTHQGRVQESNPLNY